MNMDYETVESFGDGWPGCQYYRDTPIIWGNKHYAVRKVRHGPRYYVDLDNLMHDPRDDADWPRHLGQGH